MVKTQGNVLEKVPGQSPNVGCANSINGESSASVDQPMAQVEEVISRSPSGPEERGSSTSEPIVAGTSELGPEPGSIGHTKPGAANYRS